MREERRVSAWSALCKPHLHVSFISHERILVLINSSHCTSSSQCHQFVDHICVNDTHGPGYCKHKGILPISWHGTQRPGILPYPTPNSCMCTRRHWISLPLRHLCSRWCVRHGWRADLRPHIDPYIRVRSRVCYPLIEGTPVYPLRSHLLTCLN